jgi:5-methylcytosine-specific restriction endonuclease McrA
MKTLGQCLYCPSLANSMEHVLPAAFGEFTGAPNLENRVCDECNNKRLVLLCYKVGTRWGKTELLRTFSC